MIKIHVGCGKRDFGPEWIHVDGELHSHVLHTDIHLRRHCENSASVIYSSHLLEYFDHDHRQGLLKNWYRVLKPGGILRVAVPDFEAICKAYQSGFKTFDVSGPIFGNMEMNDKEIRHKMLYDFYSLKEILESFGFKNIHRYDWRQTDHSHIDDHSKAHLPHDLEAISTGNFTDKHILISLNVEATK